MVTFEWVPLKKNPLGIVCFLNECYLLVIPQTGGRWHWAKWSCASGHEVLDEGTEKSYEAAKRAAEASINQVTA